MAQETIKILQVSSGADKLFQCLISRFPDLVVARRMFQLMFMSQPETTPHRLHPDQAVSRRRPERIKRPPRYCSCWCPKLPTQQRILPACGPGSFSKNHPQLDFSLLEQNL